MDKLAEWNENFGHNKVIVRSNENEPAKVGLLIGFEQICGSDVPKVFIKGSERFCLGLVIPYTDEMAEFLGDLQPPVQWDILQGIALAIKIRSNGKRCTF